MCAETNRRGVVVIAAVTVAELLVGVELADERHRASRQAYVEAILTPRWDPFQGRSPSPAQVGYS